MELDSNLYLHESDKAAMKALKAIPGFHQVMKAFMMIWNEQQFKLVNMSTNLRLSETQMAKYYHMLPPICEKLGIEVPEIYVELDVYPNAYTYGDTKPFIVLTSGLFETVPEELIPTVIAHECGHIACHHTLYRTMGTLLLNGASYFTTGLGNIALYPIQLAFAYWMRCSEFSADRAAMIYDGSADKVMEMCMRFAGFDKDIKAEASVESFMKQAEEYKAMVDESTFNKTLEFILFQNNDHPLNAVRAYEAREWEKTERFENIQTYLNSNDDNRNLSLPVEITPDKYIGKDISDISTMLLSKGFVNVEQVRITDYEKKAKEGEILSFSINGNNNLKKDFYKKDSNIIIDYYESKSAEEIAAEHPGEIQPLEGYKYFQGKATDIVTTMLEGAGFTTIEVKEMAIPKFGLLVKEDTVAKVIIGDNEKFDGEDWFEPETVVTIYSYVSVK
ncbi:Zn-dependent protease with chaperone function [Pseudobutyrivibrio sp. C4]|uniref:M48 family metallopeptidase n=1 Tax=Pseudobutyrivibrio sp. C4 TaxID=1520803 RepID=UPI0008BCC953|nr:M48 family metallopeptidase [Pseudobutyrivibrio sp. C4]SES64786.1 Zn-dependent protease with chaperone function [Pseudobutyrivibrio sp. C4]